MEDHISGGVDLKKEKGSYRFFKNLIQRNEFGVFIALVLVSIFFAITVHNFLVPDNILNILRQSSILGIMAVAMTMVITSGEFDLSVGSVFAFNAVIIGTLVRSYNFNIWIATIIAFIIAIIIGLFNGLITVKLKIPSFIVTLGSMMLIRGLALVVSNAWPIDLPKSNFNHVFGGSIFGVPLQAVWFILIVIVGYIVLQKSIFGLNVFATGGNKEAAKLSGINTDKTKIICFILTACAATLASLTSMGYLGSISPTQGNQMEMMAIAASVIGNTALTGGAGFIIGTFFGAIIIGMVKNGLVLLGTNAYLQDATLGGLILISVIINILLSRKNNRSR